MASKIAVRDFRSHKIYNHDLAAILIVSSLHHQIYQYKYAFLVLAIGLFLTKYIGAGDVKLLALVVLIHPDALSTYSSLAFCSGVAILICLIYIIRYRKLKFRIPIGPALCVGLLL